MDYKKIFRNQYTRFKLLKLFDFIPDKIMIRIQYFIKTGERLNLKKPKRFTEKLQWYKLNYRDPLMVIGSDKYKVRKYVKSKGLENILTPLYGVYDSSKEINFNKLPEKFVLKTTNGSKTVMLVEKKSELNLKKTREKLDGWIKGWEGKLGREWAYYDVQPKIIAEEYIESEDNNLIDYKFFCFNGEPLYLYVIKDRNHQEGLKMGIFDLEFNQLNVKRGDIDLLEESVDRPENFSEMINIVKKLSEDFPHVRVDLYNNNGEIIFGELTFYNGSGYNSYEPEEFDYFVGNHFLLPNKHL